MSTQEQIADMVVKLRHLMVGNENNQDFVQPSLLKEVPSFTSSGTAPMNLERNRAELGRRTF